MELQDAVGAVDVREGVPHLDVVRLVRHVVADVLVHLAGLATLRVDVVATGVVGVDLAGRLSFGGAGEGVLVEAFLVGNAVRVAEVTDVAQEELEVSLWVL